MISMENMRWAVFESNGNGGMTHSLQQQPPWMQNKSSIEQTAVVSFPPPPPFTIPSPNSDYDSNSLESKISPSILWIIIILAVIFFVSGLLHLLVRFLVRPVIRRDDDEVDNVTVLQGQLQQLFHLHDAGVDQSFIDTLPVFLYKTIIGVKSPFDCAVCLCEFEGEDKLRLLPKCSHAFHLDCIDTWLLSHSTCPLCRGSLLMDYTSTNINSPIVLVLESAGSESSREIVDHRQDTSCNPAELVRNRANSCLNTEERFGSCRIGNKEKVILMDEIPSVITPLPPAGEDVKVVSIKLGKLKKEVASSQSGIISGAGGGETSCNVNSRRCYSMGSYEYVLDETSLLQVPIHPTARKNSIKRAAGSHRPTISMYEIPKISQTKRDHEASNSGVIEEGRKESYSISKTWLRSKKETIRGVSSYSSRRDFSFRFPALKEDQEDRKLKQYTISSRRSNWSEIEVEHWANSQRYAISVMEASSEFGMEDGLGRSFRSTDSHHWNNNLRSESFAKRTLNWIIGRQNKVVHSSSAPPPPPPPPV